MQVKKKNILFIIGWPLNFGGHIYSTLSYVTQLSKNRHTVYLLTQKGPLSKYFEKVTNRIFYNKFLCRKRLINLLALLHIVCIILKYKIQVIHAQDFQALRPALVASKITKTKLIFTKAGGALPKYNLPVGTLVIVFSRELFDGFSKKYEYLVKNLRLIEPRIDVSLYSPLEVTPDFLHKYKLPITRDIKIIMCTRAVQSKEHLIKTFLTTAVRCVKKGLPSTFIFSGDGVLYDEMLYRCKQINMLTKRQIVTMTGAVNSIVDLVKLYNYGDIIIGHGRGIMEAMSCGRCVICIGRDGTGSLVTSDNIDIVSYYNFSGRHLLYHPDFGMDITTTVVEIAENYVRRRELGDWGRQYITRYYRSELALEKMLNIYSEIE